MINCEFENKGKAKLRHVTVTAIMLNASKTKTLLVKRSAFLTNPGLWAMPGGFLSRDETTAQCAVREALEETGYNVKVQFLFRINDDPQRPKEDRQNVDFAYIVLAKKKVQTSDNESSDVQWFDLNNLPADKEFAFDHDETIRLYKRWEKEKFALPVVNNK